MKKLLIILLIPISVTSLAQVGFTGSFGYQQTPVSKFDFQYKIKQHSVIGTIQPNLTRQSKYKAITAAIQYGYYFKSWQPYVGYSNLGMVTGVNKYLKGVVIGAGVQGNHPFISLGVTTLKITNSDYFTNNDYAIIALQLLSGFSNGLHEAIQAGHWGSGNKFWDHSISWKNKYKDFDAGDQRPAYPGSKTVFVAFTDGYHITNFVTNQANIATLCIALTSKEKVSLKTVAKKVLLSIAANRAAYYISYEVVFK